jgi:hypothetical protein
MHVLLSEILDLSYFKLKLLVTLRAAVSVRFKVLHRIADAVTATTRVRLGLPRFVLPT